MPSLLAVSLKSLSVSEAVSGPLTDTSISATGSLAVNEVSMSRPGRFEAVKPVMVGATLSMPLTVLLPVVWTLPAMSAILPSMLTVRVLLSTGPSSVTVAVASVLVPTAFTDPIVPTSSERLPLVIVDSSTPTLSLKPSSMVVSSTLVALASVGGVVSTVNVSD